MKYIRKTPVEAIQWTGHNLQEVSEFISLAAKSYSMWNDNFGNLDMTYSFQKGRTSRSVVPLFGWVVKDGKSFEFYKDSTFRKNFEEVSDDEYKEITDSIINDLNKMLEEVRASIGIPHDSLANLINNFYRDGVKTREEVEKQLSEGLKEMAGSDTHKATFESVLDEMKELHAKKDKDYSGSFHNLFKEYGMPYAFCHIEEKLNRVKAIIANGGNAVTNEHVEDSLIDGACYNILTLIELRNRKH